MSTFITRLSGGTGARVAVKDLIDMAGMVTTAGSRVLERRGVAATADAACLHGLRAAAAAGEARVVGRTNLHELAMGITGVNPWFGTPVNPLDARLVPGGSSSGSAVAVATDEADVGIGSDTGGSIRIPAACCGIAGLKTTWGRIPLDGVWPLAPSLDTIGPLARDAAGLVSGMALLEPGFTIGSETPAVVGRFRITADPAVDEAIDRALADAGLLTVDVDLLRWGEADRAAIVLLAAEAWQADRELLRADVEGIGSDVAARLMKGGSYSPQHVAASTTTAAAWRLELEQLFTRVQVIALPTLTGDPTAFGEDGLLYARRATMPINLAGVPAVSISVPRPGALPASLQLIGPWGSEALLLTTAAVVESAVTG